ncbi:putative membrane protein [Allocatelliglobosispora scoriae]|uniref:Putative membrane protein n=1 Tax=Allocatelliglobosispora scoriae TaxID=643052 RepID=A0A841BYU8_9ACTN|nr:phage holin family protein [Allocatelliglobosispora scoriae]MBB5871841.1 putative membrane protein [Allocatelliglobosispora scoriae]
MGFFIRLIVTAVALWLSTVIVSGITVSGKGWLTNTLTLIAVALIFGLINAVLKPLIKIFGCFFYIITLGLIALVVNALLFLLTSWVADKLNLPFHVDGFWAAFWGAIIVGLVSWAANLAFGRDKDKPVTAS